MQTRAGFTLVELLITILVTVMLLVLGTVSVTGFQTQARDREREADIKSIARHMETLYTSGLTISGVGTLRGEYPTFQMMRDKSDEVFAGLPKSALIAPGNTTNSLKIAGNSASPGVSPVPSQTSQYIYQPINRNGTRCYEASDTVVIPPTVSCVRFNLYYWSEATNTAVIIKSKHQ